MDSWVGALEVVESRRSPRVPLDTHVMVGTKRGGFYCLRADISPDEAKLSPVSAFQAGNTIREIDSWLAGSTVMVAAGSEDRHVYMTRLDEMVAEGDDANVQAVSVNGWIRCIAFCASPLDDGPVLAAGCGDKHLYFLTPDDFERDSQLLRRVFLDAKAHCVVGDPSSATVFCASDSRRLSVVGWTGGAYEVIEEIALPHRVTRMTFADDERRNLLAACEDGNIYLFDTVERRLTSFLPVGERVFALRGSEGSASGEILVGKDYGRLSCCFYSSQPGIPESPEGVRCESLESFAPNDFAALARILLFGGTRQAVELGIGRFIHVTDVSSTDGVACVVGTDGGDVVVLQLEDGRGRVVHRETFEKLRVWAVYAAWERSGRLRILAATSHSNLIAYVIDMRITPPEIVKREDISLNDWPREIRPVEQGAGRPRMLICCENGDLLVRGEDGLDFETDQVLRSGYARRVNGRYDILTGSDDCFITRFRDGEEQWRYETDDRVREAIIGNEECVAVSEDRYLYVLGEDGTIRWRYRFPHRALCVDIYESEEAGRQYVVGCGDGCVYFLNEDGILAGYEFPDRIRDVKLLAEGELVVACEDGFLYFAPTLDKFLDEYFGGRHGTRIDQMVVGVRTQVGDGGFEAIGNLEPEERLLLLRHLGDWFSKPDSGMVMALIDAAAVDVLDRDHVYLHYVFARAMVETARRANLAAGRSRIEQHLKRGAGNPFVVHALLSTISAGGSGEDLPRDLRLLTDTIIVNVPLDDEWIREELVRHLHRADFFSLKVGGFDQYFRAVRIRLNALTRIIAAANENGGWRFHQSPLGLLLSYLAAPERDLAGLDRLTEMAERNEATAMVRDGLDLLALLRSDREGIDPLEEIQVWIQSHVPLAEAVEAIVSPLAGHAEEGRLDRYGLRLLAEVIDGRLRSLDPRVSALDYLSIMFVRGFLSSITVRSGVGEEGRVGPAAT